MNGVVAAGIAERARRTARSTRAFRSGSPGRARIDYSSQLTLNQFYSRDLYNATQGTSSAINANIAGSWQLRERVAHGRRATRTSSTPTESIISGSLPSLTASVSSRRSSDACRCSSRCSRRPRVPLYVQKNGATGNRQQPQQVRHHADAAGAGEQPAVPDRHAEPLGTGRPPTAPASTPRRTGQRVEESYTRQLRRDEGRLHRPGVQPRLHAQQLPGRPAEARDRTGVFGTADHQPSTARTA